MEEGQMVVRHTPDKPGRRKAAACTTPQEVRLGHPVLLPSEVIEDLTVRAILVLAIPVYSAQMMGYSPKWEAHFFSYTYPTHTFVSDILSCSSYNYNR